jgi:anti-sigma B factor antagonist
MASVSVVSMREDSQVQAPPLTVRVRRRGMSALLELHGELDLSTAEDFLRFARTALAARPRRVIVDMSEVEFLGIAGYHALIRLVAEYEAAGCGLELRAPSPAVRRVLEILPSPDRVRLNGQVRLTGRTPRRWWRRP